MSTTEAEETTEVAEEPTSETETTEEEPVLAPAAELDDLFSYEEEITSEEENEDLSELDEDELRQRLAKAEKRASFEREQRLQSSRKNWESEAKEHFPYSDPKSIKADSRRSFLEAAKQQDSAFRERAKPIIDKVDKDREEMKAELRAEVEKEMQDAWGKPTNLGAGTTGFTPEEETEDRLKSARSRRNLKDVASALMDSGRI